MYSIPIVMYMYVWHKKPIVWSFAGVIESHTIIIISLPLRNNWAFIDSHYMLLRLQTIINGEIPKPSERRSSWILMIKMLGHSAGKQSLMFSRDIANFVICTFHLFFHLLYLYWHAIPLILDQHWISGSNWRWK